MKPFITLILLLITLSSTAQRQKRERIRTLKVAFITEKLDLTPKEAQEFWPVYNAFDKQVFQVRSQELRTYRREIRTNYDAMSEEEARILLNKFNTAMEKLHQINTEFSKKVIQILPAKKVIQLKIAETDFNKKMLQELKKAHRDKL
jgi:hypothetical protein